MWKLAFRHLALATMLALPVSIGVGSGCGQAHDICDVVCECTKCNDRSEDNCLNEISRMIDKAAAYDCSDDMDKYVECVVSDNDCDDASFSANACFADELQDVLECIDDASDITGPIVGEGEGEGEGPQGGAFPQGGAGGAGGVGGTPLQGGAGGVGGAM